MVMEVVCFGIWWWCVIDGGLWWIDWFVLYVFWFVLVGGGIDWYDVGVFVYGYCYVGNE